MDLDGSANVLELLHVPLLWEPHSWLGTR